MGTSKKKVTLNWVLVAELLNQWDYSFADLGRMSGVGHTNIERYRHGKLNPSPEIIDLVVSFLIKQQNSFVEQEYNERRLSDAERNARLKDNERLRQALIINAPQKSPIAGPLKVYIDSDAYNSEEKGEILSLLSELYSIQSNDRLVIDQKGQASAKQIEVVGPNGGES